MQSYGDRYRTARGFNFRIHMKELGIRILEHHLEKHCLLTLDVRAVLTCVNTCVRTPIHGVNVTPPHPWKLKCVQDYMHTASADQTAKVQHTCVGPGMQFDCVLFLFLAEPLASPPYIAEPDCEILEAQIFADGVVYLCEKVEQMVLSLSDSELKRSKILFNITILVECFLRQRMMDCTYLLLSLFSKRCTNAGFK